MKKILIIRFSSIGDIVLTTPVIRCIKSQFPNTEIHYLTKKVFASIVINNPHITKVHAIDSSIREVMSALKEENFNFIVDLHGNIRSLQVKRMLGKSSSTFKKLNFKKWMLVSFMVDTMPALHVVDRYMAAASPLGVKNDSKGVDYFIPKEDEVNITTLPPSHQNGYIGFVIGAKHLTKKLPLDKIIAICKKINQPIILIGGREDNLVATEIEKAVGDTIYNSCGKYNLNQSASLVKQATKIVSHDTGMMHIAAAFKKEIISIWGSTVPSFGFEPYFPGEHSKTVEVKGLGCRPCSKIGYNKCPKGHFKCMNDIDETAFVD